MATSSCQALTHSGCCPLWLGWKHNLTRTQTGTGPAGVGVGGRRGPLWAWDGCGTEEACGGTGLPSSELGASTSFLPPCCWACSIHLLYSYPRMPGNGTIARLIPCSQPSVSLFAPCRAGVAHRCKWGVNLVMVRSVGFGVESYSITSWL